MKIKNLFFLLFNGIVVSSIGQCDTTYVPANLTQNSDAILSGVIYVDGKFTLPAGRTIFVQSYEFGGCGSLEIHANEIEIAGTIDGNFSGYLGGNGGALGEMVSSVTGHVNALTGCQNKDDNGRVEVEGGKKGTNGYGPGAGNAGNDGGQGSGPKQQCLTGDEAGMIAGGGGAGGGAGGSYGGKGSNGGNGGSASDFYTISGFNISTAYPVVKGNGGVGGTSENIYGTPTGFDIDLGSGGAGGGGGGRSFDLGSNGGDGGSGGGMIKLIAYQSLTVSGEIFANGKNGLAGGNGGNGGVTPKCCSDLCDDCGEATLSTGAGAGSGGGGGSGGGIYLESGNAIVITGALSVNGGNGGNAGNKGFGSGCTYNSPWGCGANQSITSGDGEEGNLGGAGSGGRIKIFHLNCNNATISPTFVTVAGGIGNGAPEDGTYEIVCGYLSTEKINIVELKIDLFPNPVQNELNYHLHGNTNLEKVIIYSSLGQIVYENNSPSNQDYINVFDLSNGLYYIQFITSSNQTTKSFIKN